MLIHAKDVIALVEDSLVENMRKNLAYLLLTSKSEHYIRDKVALRLYDKYGKKGLLIYREYGETKRIDLAVLEQRKPNKKVILFEFKIGADPHYIDIAKDYKRLVRKNARCHIVFLTLVPEKAIEMPHRGLVHKAYIKQINKHAAKGVIDVCKRWNSVVDVVTKKSKQVERNCLLFNAGKFYRYKTTAFLGVISFGKVK